MKIGEKHNAERFWDGFWMTCSAGVLMTVLYAVWSIASTLAQF
jgi:hypothetical protein